jgi:hypothetical protein
VVRPRRRPRELDEIDAARIPSGRRAPGPTGRAAGADAPRLLLVLGDWRKAGWPRSYFDAWYAQRLKQAGIEASLVDRLGLRLELMAPGLRHLDLTRAQADRLVTTAELVL